MKTVTLPLEFVKEAHKAACNDWKQRIEEHVPELAEPKTGWYWWNTNLVYYNYGEQTYGFWDGKWRDNLSFNLSLGKIPATKEEVETALRKEAENRGLWGDTKIRAHADGKCWSLGINKGTFDPIWGGEKLYNKNGVIFHKGQWAELIETPIPKSLKKAIDKLGKEKILEYLK